MTTLTPTLWEDAWLPRAPFATDDLATGVRRHRRPVARTRRYVESSPRALLSMLVVDLDHPQALEKAFWRPQAHPDPSWVSINPANGHGHLGWLLETPVVRTDSARLAPMRFAARVEAGLTTALDADQGYAGLLTKNPLHEHWETYWGPSSPYTLRELAEQLGDFFPKRLPRKLADNSGLGRNCALFNVVRQWAYSAVNRYWTDTRDDFEAVVYAHAWASNQDFAVPLNDNEVRHLARSIARWTWRNITPEQTARNRTAWGTTLSAKAAERRSEAAAKRRKIVEEALL